LLADVEQLDLHSPFTTVEEAIAFSAELRLDGRVSPEAKKASIEVIQQSHAPPLAIVAETRIQLLLLLLLLLLLYVCLGGDKTTTSLSLGPCHTHRKP